MIALDCCNSIPMLYMVKEAFVFDCLHIVVVLGGQAWCVAVFSFCWEFRLSFARCVSQYVSILHHHPPPPLTFILPVWWAFVCCFTDAALTSDSNLFITSVYASSFLPLPPIHRLARRSVKSLQSGWSNIDITLCNNTGHPFWPQPAILAIASPHKDRRWAEYGVGFVIENEGRTVPLIYSCSFFQLLYTLHYFAVPGPAQIKYNFF